MRASDAAPSAARKYWRWMSVEYQARVELQWSVFSSIAVFAFPIVALIFFWKAVYGATDDAAIAGFDVRDMVTYLILHSFVFEATWAYPGAYHVRGDIRNGTLADQLVRPQDYFLSILARWTGQMGPRVVSACLVSAVLAAFFWRDLRLPADGWRYAAAPVSIALAYLVGFTWSFLLGLAAFWTESTPPIVEQLRALFNGSLLPLAFLPGWLGVLADFTPYKYMAYFPVLVLLGKATPAEFAWGTVAALAWIALFVVAIRFVFRRGVRRFEAYGG